MSENNINDGGPAFPVPADIQFPGTPDELRLDGSYPGMTMRDYFAGQSMIGSARPRYGESRQSHLANIAREAYQIADAMLAERNRKL